MTVSRRDFFKYCVASAGALGLGVFDLRRLEGALTGGAPTVIWLHGSGCQGDSVSFLNRIASGAPAGQRTVDDILVSSVNLAYHTVVMSSAGEQAVTMINQAKRKGGYVLVLEGGIPRAFSGLACQLWSFNGQTVTYQQAIQDLAGDAIAIVCVGTCASFGGIPRSRANPTDVISGAEATGQSVINVAGCPAHPDWTAWTIVQLVLGNTITLDANNRPTALYGTNIHDNCSRNIALPGNSHASTFGQDLRCLEHLGCRGPSSNADCWSRRWNNGVNWCVDSNGMCIGCVESNFPGGDFYA